MGSYSELYIAGYPIFSAKNTYHTLVVDLIFLPEDFKKLNRPLRKRNPLVWGDTYKDEKGTEEVKVFSSRVHICRERLELYGATKLKAEEDFENALQIIRDEEIYDWADNPNITYDFYLKTIKSIIAGKQKKSQTEFYTDFVDYLIESELLLENQSIRLGLWSIFSVVPSISTVEYNLTDIMAGGWIDPEPDKLIETEKIIVFTEGKTDTEFIKAGFQLFFPHLIGYYHFIDFEKSRYEASASRLIHTIKSFVGSGIKNLVLAVFDNDTAALGEINHLKPINLPPNIKVLKYPKIDLGSNYPTLGPTGMKTMDVNGLAGSIELYLGEDCLKENGILIPIQWTGYVDSLGRYQGSVRNKAGIQKKFREKVKKAKGTKPNTEDWKELISIVQMLKDAWK